MAQETFTKEQFWAELDQLGEESVRVNLFVAKTYGDGGPKRTLAEEWLRSRETSLSAAAQKRRDTMQMTAAIAATIAATAATIGAIASIITMLSRG
jgi:hypothetical protein